MANRRMISKSISISEQVNSLSIFGALLFTWMVPHADDWGILPGAAAKIKALVVPMIPVSIQDVESALEEMKEQGLIWRYQYKDTKLIQFCKWDEHQTGLHKRTKPKNPSYHDALELQRKEENGGQEGQATKKTPDIPNNSETFPEVPGNSRLTELNRTEQNLSKDPDDDDDDNARARVIPSTDNFVKTYEQEFGRLISENELSLLQSYINDGMEQAVVCEAIRRTRLYGKTNLSYTKKILNDWIDDGVKTMAGVARVDIEFEQRKAGKRKKSSREPPKKEVGKFDFFDVNKYNQT